MRASRGVAGALALLAVGLAGAGAAAPAQALDQALAATPLVLKDGRIAQVSIFAIPFPDDAAAPDSKTRKALQAFIRTIATDCFLTAQVIGHVDKKETSGRETADIHRLARARADTVQQSLIESGLPATSIASVWDWRFMVQEARATLWIFRLTTGEDCEDAVIDASSRDQIAGADQPASPARAMASAPPKPETAPSDLVRAKPVESKTVAAKAKAAPTSPPISASPPRPEGLDGQQAASNDAAIKPASAPKAKAPAETKIAALSQGEDAEKGAGAASEAKAVEIVFATNSSYFPEGAGDKLRAFMTGLEPGKSYVLRVQTSVAGAGDVSAVSAEEAARYNAWLAERRFKRVEAWLLKNGDGRQIRIEPKLLEDDDSRTVRIEANPLG
jgi:outer membrane protein OmpA-like peptidoglycan-associated protein